MGALRLATVSHERLRGCVVLNHRPDVLTVEEVAERLRCSKALVYLAIRGKVRGVSPLPALRLGRRKLVRLVSLEKWMQENDTALQPARE